MAKITKLNPAASLRHDRGVHQETRAAQARRLGMSESTLKRIEDEDEAGRPLGLSLAVAQLLAIRLGLPPRAFLHCCAGMQSP